MSNKHGYFDIVQAFELFVPLLIFKTDLSSLFKQFWLLSIHSNLVLPSHVLKNMTTTEKCNHQPCSTHTQPTVHLLAHTKENTIIHLVQNTLHARVLSGVYTAVGPRLKTGVQMRNFLIVLRGVTTLRVNRGGVGGTDVPTSYAWSPRLPELTKPCLVATPVTGVARRGKHVCLVIVVCFVRSGLFIVFSVYTPQLFVAVGQ